MRRTQRILVPALLSGLAVARAGAQDAADVRAIKPVMMLLVDTSGSMERVAATTSEEAADEALPDFPDCSAGTPRRSRWAITLEALTGSFSSVDCEAEARTTSPKYTGAFDYGYYINHYNFLQPTVTQASNGVLDSFANRIKFGLMTFDGANTTLSGDSLVPYDGWIDNPTFRRRPSVRGHVLVRRGRQALVPGLSGLRIRNQRGRARSRQPRSAGS